MHKVTGTNGAVTLSNTELIISKSIKRLNGTQQQQGKG